MFYNKDKSLTLYSLACGYIETLTLNEIEVEFYKEPACSVYQVRTFDRSGRFVIRLQWDSFDTLTEGRKEFYKAVKLHLGLSRRQYLKAISAKENRINKI